jgi:hypothetical protein
LSLFLTSLLYIKTIGVMAGNIIAAMPAVHMTANSEIAIGFSKLLLLNLPDDDIAAIILSC